MLQLIWEVIELDLTQIFNFATGSSSSNTAITAAIITGILALVGTIFKSNKDAKLKHITSERKAWRDDLRKITYEIQKEKSINAVKDLLVKLYTRLNTRGYYDKSDIVGDGHIWHLLRNMEKTRSYSIMNMHKKKLKMFISMLLKYDWERAKQEAGLNVFSLSSNAMCIIASSFTIYVCYTNFEGTELKHIVFIMIMLYTIYFLPPLLVSLGKNKKSNRKLRNFWYPLFIAISILIIISANIIINNSEILISLFLFVIAMILDYLSNYPSQQLENRYIREVEYYLGTCQINKIKISKE